MASTGKEKAPPLFDASLLGLDDDMTDAGGSNTLIIESNKSSKGKVSKETAAPKEKMSSTGVLAVWGVTRVHI